MSDQRKKKVQNGFKHRNSSDEAPSKSAHGKTKSSPHSSKSNFKRQPSYDSVRKIVQEEGRTARNLVTWSVPVEDEGKDNKAQRPPLGSPRKVPRPRSVSDSSKGSKSRDRTTSPGVKKRISDSTPPGTPRRVGPKDLRNRYWAFLFDNLRRAVDEIYNTCEEDESVVECKEAIMMLEQSTRDFHALIERLQVMRAYESADATNKPKAIAWDVRKTSPGKALSSSQNKDFFSPSPTVSRSLSFGAQNMKASGSSWAERVKNSPPVSQVPSKQNGVAPLTSSENVVNASEAVIEDLEGWETVHKGRHGKLKRTLSGDTSSHTGGKSSPRQAQRPNRSQQPRRGSNMSNKRQLVNEDKKRSANLTVAKAEKNRPRASSIDSEKENKTELSLAQTIQSQIAKSMPDINMDKSEDPFDVDANAIETMPSESMNKEDEAYQTELEDALASALDEEISLGEQLEKENEEALQAAQCEEDYYCKQIIEEQNHEETETETESDLGTTAGSGTLESTGQQLDWDTMLKQHETERDMNKSWGEMAEEEEEVNSRTPGRSVRVHMKLSSPSRKSRSVSETKKKYEEKQAKAQEQREKLQRERKERVHNLSIKVEEVRNFKQLLMDEKRDLMSNKLTRAEEKRQMALNKIARKAREEETKANEIAFINTLEAQNKKHELIQKQNELEARLLDREEERKRKVVEEATKKAAVEARRKGIEAEKEARLQEMISKRHEREKVVSQKQQEKEKERIEQKRTREKEFEERLAAINAQEAQRKEELQRNIQQKLDESDRRYKENIAHKKGKAFEMSILRHSTDDHNDAPTSVPYETKKFCSMCNVMIASEVYLLSHLRGKKHLQALKESKKGDELTKGYIERTNLKHILDAPCDKPDPQLVVDKERQKALKKRCKKLRTRMAQRGAEYESSLSNKQQMIESDHRAKFQKVVKDLNKYAGSQDKGPWAQVRVSALDRALGEIARILEKKNVQDQHAFRLCGGLTTMNRLLLVISEATAELPPVIPSKSLVQVCSVYRLACRTHYDNCHYVLFSNKVGCLVDLLHYRLCMFIPENFNVANNASLSSSGSGTSLLTARLPTDPLASALLQLIVTVLTCLARHNPAMQASEASAERMSNCGRDAFSTRTNDILSYIISVGVVDKLSVYFDNVRGPLKDNPEAGEFVQHGLGLLIALTKLQAKRAPNNADKSTKQTEDSTQLISTLQVTHLCGIVSLMYGVLLHSDSPVRSEATPPELPVQTIAILTTGFKMLNQLATLDLSLLQSTLGEEGMSLEFRHIASYLLWHCNKIPCEELLHEVILCVGYFTLLQPDNQSVIQSGQPPTVLQQLCQLPFSYFSDPRLTNVLFPTLIASCYQCPQNRAILEQELSCALLANFIEEKLLEQQQAKSPPSAKKNKANEKENDSRMCFSQRFPQEEWTRAIDAFQAS